MITLQPYSFIVLWRKFWKRLVTYGGLSDFIIKSFSETHVLSRSLTMDPSVKTEPWLDRRDSASSSALRLSAWALASHSSTFTVEKKIHSTVSVSEENKRNHPLETSKHLPGFVKFCFLSLQNVKLLIHQWKYWKFPEYMCCFHGWNLKILLYYEKL